MGAWTMPEHLLQAFFPEGIYTCEYAPGTYKLPRLYIFGSAPKGLNSSRFVSHASAAFN